MASERDGRKIEGDLGPEGCVWRLDGSSEFTEEEQEKFGLTCPRLERTRNYYVYLWGMPMKLRDPGTLIGNEAKAVDFEGRPAQEVRVTYSEEVGSDVWYFYFDPEDQALIGCPASGITEGHLGLGRFAKLAARAVGDLIANAGVTAGGLARAGLYVALPPSWNVCSNAKATGRLISGGGLSCERHCCISARLSTSWRWISTILSPTIGRTRYSSGNLPCSTVRLVNDARRVCRRYPSLLATGRRQT